MKYLSCRLFGYKPGRVYHRLVNSRLVVKTFTVVMYSSYAAPVRESRYLNGFEIFLGLWLFASSPPKLLLSRFWMPATAVLRTRRRYKPRLERPSISRAVVACGELYLSASEVQTLSSGFIFVSFCFPLFSTNFDHCSTSKSCCWPLLRTRGLPI